MKLELIPMFKNLIKYFMLLKLTVVHFFGHQNTLKCSCRDQENQNFLGGACPPTPLAISFMGPGFRKPSYGPDMQE
jgi:hypothetical protein